MSCSSSTCSSRSSTSLSVATRCCASTSRHTRPSSVTRSDENAAGVQIGEDIDEPGYRPDLLEGTAVERAVGIPEPGACNALVPTDDRVERAEEAHEQQR